MNAPAVLNEKVLVLNRLLHCRAGDQRAPGVRDAHQGGGRGHLGRERPVPQLRLRGLDGDRIALQKEFEPDAHSWIRTPHLDIAVPKIIRLFGYDRLPKQQVKLNRRNLYARDSSRCQYCGRHFPAKDLTIDHVVPRVQGGEHSWVNLVCACVKCNTRKGGRTPAQAHMKLIRQPGASQAQPGDPSQPGQGEVPVVAGLPQHCVLDRGTAGLV